ncbi:GUN4 domain-containing protein [Microcoleus sp. LEGE 07076]|uniref:GUN4 domain-containing protein n=1 Tax=Microcoleus sp. LEGE 07076 TaxID=915322 RepID=UPI0019ED9014|nr:GUN4 domain-containing protein [Microcoleus sp. LEGE 07076]MBE9184497.1 GUN4 domain-containing protein [Microcoleus sp. LEGE 07076]
MMTLILMVIVIATIAYFVLVNKKENQTPSLPNRNEIRYPTIDESQLNDDLSSAVGIDYRNLRKCLAVKDFESANKETKSLFEKISSIDLDLMDPDPQNRKIPRIPCTDICTIDRLWVKYSEGRFGFSVQFMIWSDIYLRLYNEKKEFNRREKIESSEDELEFSANFDAMYKFYNIIGWNDSVNRIYQESAPEGHLPSLFWHHPFHYRTMVGVFHRLMSCRK